MSVPKFDVGLPAFTYESATALKVVVTVIVGGEFTVTFTVAGPELAPWLSVARYVKLSAPL